MQSKVSLPVYDNAGALVGRASSLKVAGAGASVAMSGGQAVVTVPGGGAGTYGAGLYTCDAGLAVRKLVYSSGSNACAAANAADPAKRLAIGFVRSKPAATTAEVQFDNELDGFVGLIPKAIYYMAEVDGEITATPPTTAGSVVQPVGYAKNATTLVIEIDRDADLRS